MSTTQVIIWGSGATSTAAWQCAGPEAWKQFDVRAARGWKTLGMLVQIQKLTREAAERVPVGDPALLLPDMFPRCARACKPKTDLCVILHHSDNKDLQQRKVILREAARRSDVKSFRIFGPQNNPTWMLEQILECKLVLSSSLHGIVFAEAFGVPARWLQLKGSSKSEKDFKYVDYYSGTRGRSVLGEAGELGEAPPEASGGGKSKQRFNACSGQRGRSARRSSSAGRRQLWTTTRASSGSCSP